MTTSTPIDKDSDGEEATNTSGVNFSEGAVSTGAVASAVDDDDWSRQVETDDIQRMSSSVILDGDIEYMEGGPHRAPSEAAAANGSSVSLDPDSATAQASAGLAPKRIEPTLKEKLVERERQRRVETERARWKRQFALASNGSGALDEDSVVGGPDGPHLRENGSVAGTVGEGSLVAQIDIFEDEAQKLPYPMERFLEEQSNVIQEEPPRESPRDVQNAGVVMMERFLNEPVVVVEPQVQGVESTDAERSDVDRNVSFEGAADIDQEEADQASLRSLTESQDGFLRHSLDVGAALAANTSVANASVTCITSEDPPIEDLIPERNEVGSTGDDIHDTPLLQPQPVNEIESSPQDHFRIPDEPRVLRLTEAEIQEMAAIDEASRSNAPPSDRDEISESSFVGELVSDFGAHGVDHAGTLSQGTPTTVMESASIASGNQSAHPAFENADDPQSFDVLGIASVSSQLIVSSGGGSVSVTANPPSDIGEERAEGQEEAPSRFPDDIPPLTDPSDGLEPLTTPVEAKETRSSELMATAPALPDQDTEPLGVAIIDNATEVENRQIRPGMVQPRKLPPTRPPVSAPPSTPIRRVLSVPGNMSFEVDGFDYDKNMPISPGSGFSESMRDLPANDLWSPGSRMSLSPLHVMGIPSPRDPEVAKARNYGTTFGTGPISKRSAPGSNRLPPGPERDSELEPLIPDIPNIIVASKEPGRKKPVNLNGPADPATLMNIAGGAPAEDSAAFDSSRKEAQDYSHASLVQRAFSGRFVALLVTLVLEVPIVLMVAGGGDRLCMLMGRTNYHLFMGFLPLSCALSGHLSLQANSCTTEAMIHGHVTTGAYKKWVLKEIGAAVVLGISMGALLGALAFLMSGHNIQFGMSLMVAQVFGIVSAAGTGIVASLVCNLAYNRAATKWREPLLIALQDIVGTFAMVVISYEYLERFGGIELDESEFCGNAPPS